MNCREQPAPEAVGIRSKRQQETDEPLLLMNVVNESAPLSVCVCTGETVVSECFLAQRSLCCDLLLMAVQY